MRNYERRYFNMFLDFFYNIIDFILLIKFYVVYI